MTLILLDGVELHVIERVPEGEAVREHHLRDLIYEVPEALPVRELDPGIGRIVSVAKEVHLPDSGYIDVLLISEHGKLVVVECKLWRNPQARREVVGQILDYARELSRYGYEDLQRTVSSRLGRTGNVLFELARNAGSQLSEADFVDRVSRDLAAGRFLLLVVGDGIKEGTRRIGEFLSGQAGLSFDFGLVEMAEYRFRDPVAGTDRRVLQPKLLARTVVLERHVIRNSASSVIIEDAADLGTDDNGSRQAVGARNPETLKDWREFALQFIASVQFDDPAQQPPRVGGVNWMRLPLPSPLMVTLWRSTGSGMIGAFLRCPGDQGTLAYAALESERQAIDAEFAAAGLPVPKWNADGNEPSISIRVPSALPWDSSAVRFQAEWLGIAANQFVNSIRPRLLRLLGAS